MATRKRPAAAKTSIRKDRSARTQRQASGRLVRIHVAGVDGRSIELKLDRNSGNSAIKQLVAKAWNIPPSCQRLVHGTTILSDADCIHKLCSDKEDTLELCVIMTVDGLCEKMETEGRAVKLHCLEDLRKIGRFCGNAHIRPICRCLVDCSPQIRKYAVSTLSVVAEKDCHLVIDQILAASDELDRDTVGMFSDSGKEFDGITAALYMMVEKEYRYLITGLVERSIGEERSQVACWLLAHPCCSNYSNSSKIALLVAAMLEVSCRKGMSGDEAAFELDGLLFDLCRSDGSDGRRVHTEKYRKMLEALERERSLEVVRTLMTHFSNHDSTFQPYAIEVLRKLLGLEAWLAVQQSGSKLDVYAIRDQLVAALSKSFVQEKFRSTFLTLRSLDIMMDPPQTNDALAVAVLYLLQEVDRGERDWSEHEYALLRAAALEVLGKSAAKGDREAITASSSLLTNCNKHVRTAAMRALSKLVDCTEYSLEIGFRLFNPSDTFNGEA